MPSIDDLQGSELKKLWAAVKKLQTQTPLTSASVERGRLRFYAGSELLIQNGNLTVSGTATIDGQMIGTGTLTWSGTTNLTGNTNLDGPTSVDGVLTINGATTVVGPLSITGQSTFTGKTYLNGEVDLNGPFDVFGDSRIYGTMLIDGITTLNDNLIVANAGKITVDNMTIGETANGGGLEFTNGATLAAEGTGVAMYSGFGYVAASPTQAIISHGGNSVQANSSGVQVGGNFHISQLPTTNNAPNLWVDPGNGRIYRCL